MGDEKNRPSLDQISLQGFVNYPLRRMNIQCCEDVIQQEYGSGRVYSARQSDASLPMSLEANRTVHLGVTDLLAAAVQ